MGTLGRYLHDARVARGIDLREAAQQTRISLQYLRALEEEDFKKLPGDVFVKGFLKNYGKYLRLDEAELMKQYSELLQKPSPVGVASQDKQAAEAEKPSRSSKIPIEPFIWGAGIVIILIVFLLIALPARHPKETRKAAESPPAPAAGPELFSAAVPSTPEKLYLEVFALDNTWVLVRTDASPQKKAILKKGESLIWSADQRFLLSYGSAGAVRLLLNGQELTVDEPKNAVVRDLTVTAAGIVNRKTPGEKPKTVNPKRQHTEAVLTQPSPSAVSQQTTSVRAPQRPQSPPPLPPAPGKMPKRPAQ